jgi:hypothetical protein
MPAPAPLPPAPQAAEAAAIELPREISLDKYCERYKVNPEDRRVLTEIGYIPGDNGIKDLDADAWATTKVLALAKARISRQHTAFLKEGCIKPGERSPQIGLSWEIDIRKGDTNTKNVIRPEIY